MATTKKETSEAIDPISGEPMVRIMLPKANKDDSQLFVAVNGRNFLIKKGTPVMVPEYIAKAIEMYDEQCAKNMELEAELGI